MKTQFLVDKIKHIFLRFVDIETLAVGFHPLDFISKPSNFKFASEKDLKEV